MEISRLRSFLRSHPRIALDTCIFIYQWEANPRYSPITDHIFSSLENVDFIAVTSTVTMTELLVHPYRQKDLTKANHLFGLFSSYPNLEWLSPDLQIAALAASIRGNLGLGTPDALEAATAISAGASALITNDPVFRRIANLEILVLDDVLSGSR